MAKRWEAAKETIEAKLERVRDSSRVEAEKEMSPADYQAALARLGLNGTAAAALIGVCARTEIRWATGRVPVPKPVTRLLRLVEYIGLNNASKELAKARGEAGS